MFAGLKKRRCLHPLLHFQNYKSPPKTFGFGIRGTPRSPQRNSNTNSLGGSGVPLMLKTDSFRS